MTPVELNNFLETVARQNRAINHTDAKPRFASLGPLGTANPGQALALNDGPCLVNLTPTYTGIGENHDVNVMDARVRVAIVRSAGQTAGPERVKEVEEETFRLGMKILGYLVKLQEDGDPALLGAQLHRARLVRTGPILDSGHGWELSFPLHMETSELMAFDETEWDL